MSLQVGQSLDVSDVKVGDDFYFECKIKSNPKVDKIIWTHNVSMNAITN